MPNDKDDKVPEINPDIPEMKITSEKVNMEPRRLKGDWKAYEYLPGQEPPLEKKSHPKPIEHYISRQGQPYEPPGSQSGLSLEVLPFLKGKPLNDLTFNYLMALRPSFVRIVLGEETCDAMRWRVTIYLEGDKTTIKKITQECDVGCVGAHHGSDLAQKLRGLR